MLLMMHNCRHPTKNPNHPEIESSSERETNAPRGPFWVTGDRMEGPWKKKKKIIEPISLPPGKISSTKTTPDRCWSDFLQNFFCCYFKPITFHGHNELVKKITIRKSKDTWWTVFPLFSFFFYRRNNTSSLLPSIGVMPDHSNLAWCLLPPILTTCPGALDFPLCTLQFLFFKSKE